MVHSKLYKQAVDKFGKEHQLLVTVGEMSEAIAEIARHQIPERQHDEDLLIEELADVQIMLSQCKIIYGERLTQAICKKLNKLERHVND